MKYSKILTCNEFEVVLTDKFLKSSVPVELEEELTSGNSWSNMASSISPSLGGVSHRQG